MYDFAGICTLFDAVYKIHLYTASFFSLTEEKTCLSFFVLEIYVFCPSCLYIFILLLTWSSLNEAVLLIDIKVDDYLKGL